MFDVSNPVFLGHLEQWLSLIFSIAGRVYHLLGPLSLLIRCSSGASVVESGLVSKQRDLRGCCDWTGSRKPEGIVVRSTEAGPFSTYNGASTIPTKDLLGGSMTTAHGWRES